jgi:hypothetical protein
MPEQHSPTPPQNGGKRKTEAWEFSAIPWTFPLDQAQTIEGWEPFAVASIPFSAEMNGEAHPIGKKVCLIVRRPA